MIRIKNFSEFQHFKDRRPPWIRLYRYLLDDREWHDLPGDDAKLLVELWLIASEDKQMEGNLPDLATLSWRLRRSEAALTAALERLSHWVESDENDVDITRDIARENDTPRPEERRDREETETEKTLVSAGADLTVVHADQEPDGKPERFAAWWNENRDPALAKCRELTKDRRTKILARLKEHPDKRFWDLVMSKINSSDFLRGKTKGRAWKVSIDFVIANASNCVRIAEGQYGDERATPADAHDRLAEGA